MKNQQVPQLSYTIDELLAYLESGKRFAYDAGAGPRILNRMQRDYARLSALAESISDAQQEGIIEVTVRSSTKTITLPVSPTEAGHQAAEELYEQVCKRLDKLNIDIMHQLKDHHEMINKYGHDNGNPKKQAIHALCLPAAPLSAAGKPEVVEGERCPFLPAAVAPIGKRVKAASTAPLA